MAANRELLDAFNDSIDRLSLGQPLDVLLSQYPPRLAAQLRPMLEAAQLAQRSMNYPASEVDTARLRARGRVLDVLQAAPLPSHGTSSGKKEIRFPTRQILAAAAVLILVAGAVALLYPRSETPAATETPTPEILTATPTPTDSLTPSITPSPSPEGCQAVAPEGWVTYRIQSGDTLSDLAVRTDSTLEELQAVNCITEPRLLRVGQEIFLPYRPTAGGGGTSPTATGGNTGGGGGNVSPTEEDDDDDDDDSSDDDDDSSDDD